MLAISLVLAVFRLDAATPQTNHQASRTADCLFTLAIEANGRSRIISDHTVGYASIRYYGRLLASRAVNGAGFLSRFEFRTPVSAISARSDGGATWISVDGAEPVALPADDAKDFDKPLAGKSFLLYSTRAPTRVQLIVRGPKLEGGTWHRPAMLAGTRENGRTVAAEFRQAVRTKSVTAVLRYFGERGVYMKAGRGGGSRVDREQALAHFRGDLATASSPTVRETGSRVVIDLPQGGRATHRWIVERLGSNWTVASYEQLAFIIPGR